MKLTESITRIPWLIVFCAVGLMLMGLSGISRGDELANGRLLLFSRQLVWVVLVVPIMFAATIIPYRSLRGLSYPAFAATLILLVVVFFMPARNGARAWIPLGLMDFQPSELAKLTYMMSLAHYLMHRENYRKLVGLLVPFVLT
jgi:cell division protein FtsW (lipid II flippase)